MSNNLTNHLKELGESKYEIVAGESDIRNWTVKNDFGRILGKVNDLIFDTRSQTIKYFILDTNGNELYLSDRRVLLPIEYAELDEIYKNVIFPGLMANELSSLPSYDKHTLNDKAENMVYATFMNYRKKSNIEHKADNFIRNSTENSHLGNSSTSHEHISTNRHQPFIHEPKHQNDYETKYLDQHTDETAKHQSVASVFQNRDEADHAIARLIEAGFHRREIQISFRDEDEIARGDFHENEGISGFFSNFFNTEESDWLNSDSGKKFPVVIVNKLSIAEAERAAEILDRFGAINVDENLRHFQLNKEAEMANSKYNSRII